MFRTWSLSKSFAVLSGPLLVGAGLLTATMNHVGYVDGIEQAAERNNVALARILSNVVWPKYRADVLAEDSANTTWRIELMQEIAALARNTAIVKVKFYRADGVTAFSTDPTEIGERKDHNDGFQSAMAGKVVSELEFEDEISTFDRVINDRNTVSSYLPILDADNPGKVV